MYNYMCEYCGAALDPNEKCDCRKETEQNKMRYLSMFSVERNGQYKLEVEQYGELGRV